MSAGNNSEDDLTTDAVPSPPRDEIKEQRTENATQNVPPRTKTKVFKKPKKVGPSVSASNVINIKNSQGIHVGSDYKIYINSNKAETPKQKDFVVTDTINELFTSERLVERKDLIFISLHINEHWRTMARALDFSDGRISHFYEDYIKSGIKEVIYQVLLEWIQIEADCATVGKLSKVLWNTSQEDAVKRWSEHVIKNKT